MIDASPVETNPTQFDWRLFWILMIAGLGGATASAPLALEIVDRIVPESEQQEFEAELPLPIPLLILAAVIQNGAIFGIAIATGMALTPRIGTGAPLLKAWLHGPAQPNWLRTLLGPVAAGLILGVALAVIDAFMFLPRAPAALQDFAREVPLWKRLLAGLFYGGVTEELLMRWFLLSLVVWLISKVWATVEGRPTAGAWWLANFAVALVFGLGHLPATQALAPLSAVVVARALLLNGVAGLLFGYLFWRRGLEAAVAAHAAAHLGLQVLGPLLGR